MEIWALIVTAPAPIVTGLPAVHPPTVFVNFTNVTFW